MSDAVATQTRQAVAVDEVVSDGEESARLILDESRALQAENAKLREMCVSLYEFAMSEYPDGTELNFADRLRELGVEVDE